MATPTQPQGLYGRAYKLTVSLPKSNQELVLSSDSFTPSSLQFSFRISTVGYHWYYPAEIKIYNLVGALEEQIIQEGWNVVVEAGYQNGNYGKIFDGYIFQPIRDRENVVDYTLTLNCLNCMKVLSNNIVSFTANAGLDPRGQMQQICQQAKTPINLGGVSPNISTVKLPRAKVFFGAPKKYFRQIANGSNAQWYVDDKGHVNVSKITDAPTAQPIIYTPSSGLIGTPEQVDYGFSLRVLLDPRVRISNPPMLVGINNALIRQQKAQLGQILSILDQDGTGKVISVEHVGDTRGNDWYTDIVTVSSKGKIPAQLIQSQNGVFTRTNINQQAPKEFDPPDGWQGNAVTGNMN